MMISWILAFAVALAVLPHSSRQDADTYDYIVIGCGISGLVVSTRLSERYDVSVLCLEAGDFDSGEPEIVVPYYIGRQPPGFYDWGLQTTPQTQLDGGVRRIHLGRGVGGGSLINGMVWNRGNRETYDSWESLGSPGWSWKELLSYFRKSETFSPRTYLNQNISIPGLDSNIHGVFGPISVTYPPYYWNQTNAWFEALTSAGIPTVSDPDDGLAAGGYFLPLNLLAGSQTRHDARRAYFEPVRNRTNLLVQPNSHVNRILFDTSTGIRAAAVQYYSSLDNTSEAHFVYARQEVVVAAGALHTPQILELSGIGQTSILEAQNVTVILDLPGVGNNLQDHPLVHLDYPYSASGLLTPKMFDYNATFNRACEEEYLNDRSGPWTAAPSQAVAFPSLRQFVADVDQLLRLNTSNSSAFLPRMYDDSVTAGIKLQHQSILASLSDESVPVIEILNNNAGGLDLALQRPLSRGSVHIGSNDPWSQPLVNPNWLSHPLDIQIMVQGMRLNQRLLETSSLQSLQPTYKSVPFNATQQQLVEILRSGIGTEFHPCGTAAMMARHLGGVVDASLKVYGTKNLRVVDTSIVPIIPAAHLQALTYAIAEKAADIIKGVAPGPS